MTVIEQNAPSGLLSPAENTKIWEILHSAHRKNQALAISVVKLYLSEPKENHRTWVERVCGAVCFTKDYGRKSYYIQIFDMQYYQMVWEQELYEELQYRAVHKWFHSFEAEHCMAGLSFADEREGQTFQSVVQSKIEQRRVKRQSASVAAGKDSGGGVHQSPKVVVQASPKLVNKVEAKKTEEKTKSKKKKDSKKQRKITKIEISGPDTSSFVHVAGVKSDGGQMKMVDNSHMIDPTLKKYLAIAGIDASTLGIKEIEKVKEFAARENVYGEVERRKTVLKNERRQSRQIEDLPPGAGRTKRPPPPGARSRPPPGMPVIREGQPSPQVPKRTPPLPSRPQAAPPSIPTRKSPSLTPRVKQSGGPPPPPSGGPPPPPPPPAEAPAPQKGTPPPPKPASGEARGDLLTQIRSGANLKPAAEKGPPPNPSSGGDGRVDLLSQIRQGAKLRAVDPEEIKDRSSNSVEETGGLMGALKGALMNIHEANFSSDDSDEDDDSDDDWGDEDDESNA